MSSSVWQRLLQMLKIKMWQQRKDGNYSDPSHHSLGWDLEHEILPAYLEREAL